MLIDSDKLKRALHKADVDIFRAFGGKLQLQDVWAIIDQQEEGVEYIDQVQVGNSYVVMGKPFRDDNFIRGSIVKVDKIIKEDGHNRVEFSNDKAHGSMKEAMFCYWCREEKKGGKVNVDRQ